MQPSEYLSALRKHWIVIVLLGVLGAVAGYGYSTTLPERYRATASVSSNQVFHGARPVSHSSSSMFFSFSVSMQDQKP